MSINKISTKFSWTYIFFKSIINITFSSILFIFLGCKSSKIPLKDYKWKIIDPLPLNADIENQISQILAKLSLEQKVGQVIQGDSDSVTPEEVKKYRLGSVLSGGNSAPGPLPYADTQSWLKKADAYYNASIDEEGVEIAIPIIWGIDAVHGHANLKGAIIFPHNIGLGATKNPDLIEKIASITAHELTVSGHDWTFAPTLAIPKDTRWGRSYEGFSENPEIAELYGDRIVIGLQGKLGSKKFMTDGKVISSAKHFLADGATLNGVDQGDAPISEEELARIHAAGYYSTIPAGVQTIMASFSSWQGRKLHGDKELLTDILKGKMGFNGFVVGDWNGHGQVPGCSNTSCALSLNAGLDMYMAPDSWRGLYENTLQQVKDGKISMTRLDDAVRRILRVKLNSGIFEKGKPSDRPNAGNEELLGLIENRKIARQAVRESLVLLKNNNHLLPINPKKTILVVGDGASSISKACGGWTLSWQGNGHKNHEFPNATSILDGIKDIVGKSGGKVIFSPNGDESIDADVVIAVYGEDPYAEFQGDRDNLDFIPNGFDVKKLGKYKKRGIPVVSVFLSGRPLWVNQEINNSDAFVAAWLPGTEGGGISDLLFKSDLSYDFKGKLSFTWPNVAYVAKDNEPLFGLGYGLNYYDSKNIGFLSEISGLNKNKKMSTGEFYKKGLAVEPWSLWLVSGELEKQILSYPTSLGGLIISKTDYQAQEDALRINWTKSNGDYFRVSTNNTNDMTRQSNGAMKLTFIAKSFQGPNINIQIGLCDNLVNCSNTISLNLIDNWKEYKIPLSDFEKMGVDMGKITSAFLIKSKKGSDIGLTNIRIE